MLVTLKLNDHINTAGITPEHPVHQGDDLCPARDGTRSDWPLSETALGMERESLLPRGNTGKGKTGVWEE